jgi:hypothetical protein
MQLTGPTNAVELRRSRLPRGRWWHLLPSVGGEGRADAMCGVECYPSWERVLASRADLRMGFVRFLCMKCFPLEWDTEREETR